MGDDPPEVSGLQREYDWDEVDPAVAIIETIAALEHGEGTDLTSVLDQPLHTYTEPDALNTLVRSEGTTSITLRISSYHVQIHGSTVGVSPIES